VNSSSDRLTASFRKMFVRQCVTNQQWRQRGAAQACRLATNTPSVKMTNTDGVCSGRRRFLSNNHTSRQAQPKRGGGYLIGFGWALLGVVAVDQALQYYQDQQRAEISATLADMQRQADFEQAADWPQDLPVLWEYQIGRIEASLDGVKMLRNIQIGDTVEILQEGVGPNRAYHLCRVKGSSKTPSSSSSSSSSMGWYPIQYLKEIE
jgi:hypothetical protein